MLYQLSYLATACACERAQKSNYNTGKTPENSGDLRSVDCTRWPNSAKP